MNVTAQQCIEFVCESYGVSVDCVVAGGRTMEYVWPKWVAMRLCRHYTGYSFGKIGKLFGTDHTAVIHGLKRLEEAMETDKHIASDVGLINSAFTKEFDCEPVEPSSRLGYTLSKYSLAGK